MAFTSMDVRETADAIVILAVLAILDVLMILYCISLICRLIWVKSNLPNVDLRLK